MQHDSKSENGFFCSRHPIREQSLSMTGGGWGGGKKRFGWDMKYVSGFLLRYEIF